MDYQKIESKASAMAMKAKPGVIKIDGSTYTLVFDYSEWVYRVYQDGFAIVNFNTKSLAKAKQWLREYIAN
jgi:hypothetical protein